VLVQGGLLGIGAQGGEHPGRHGDLEKEGGGDSIFFTKKVGFPLFSFFSLAFGFFLLFFSLTYEAYA
jgi:hypothetical protein